MSKDRTDLPAADGTDLRLGFGSSTGGNVSSEVSLGAAGTLTPMAGRIIDPLSAVAVAGSGDRLSLRKAADGTGVGLLSGGITVGISGNDTAVPGMLCLGIDHVMTAGRGVPVVGIVTTPGRFKGMDMGYKPDNGKLITGGDRNAVEIGHDAEPAADSLMFNEVVAIHGGFGVLDIVLIPNFSVPVLNLGAGGNKVGLPADVQILANKQLAAGGLSFKGSGRCSVFARGADIAAVQRMCASVTVVGRVIAQTADTPVVFAIFRPFAHRSRGMPIHRIAMHLFHMCDKFRIADTPATAHTTGIHHCHGAACGTAYLLVKVNAGIAFVL